MKVLDQSGAPLSLRKDPHGVLISTDLKGYHDYMDKKAQILKMKELEDQVQTLSELVKQLLDRDTNGKFTI